MTSDPTGDSYSTDGEREPRWQQPAFRPDPPGQAGSNAQTPQPMQPFHVNQPAPFVAPPSMLETVVGTMAALVWPIAILLIIFAKVGFWPVLVIAIVGGALLRAVKNNLKSRRRAVLPPPPFDPGGSGDLR